MVQALPDYYLILGVPRYTKPEGIRRAFLRKAWEYHPDVHPDDPDAAAAMSSINEAYATLSNPGRRVGYDHIRSTAYIRPPHAGPTPTGPVISKGRSHRNQGPGVLDTAWAVIMRLMRYATAILPL